MTTQTITLPITGMTCANCAMNIERTLKKLPGISKAAVNFASEQAGVTFDDTAVSVPEIVGAINKAGFKAHTFSTEFPVTGMTCANCAMNIETDLGKKVPGVSDASRQLRQRRATVEFLPS